jgi:HlyD family secretion protein
MASARFGAQALTVRAPWGGTVTNLLSVRGAPVDTTSPIVTVADLSRLSAAVDLSEFDAALVKRGLKATVGVDALGGKAYRGTVRFAALTGTNNGGLVIFPVQVGLKSAQGLKPGMNVSVRIIVAERRNVLQVPLEAISRDDEDRPIVEVLDASGEPVTRRVKIGMSNNQKVEIVSGLKAGERVVLAETTAPEEEA